MNEDDYAMQEPGSEPESDSDFEYEGGKGKRGKGKKGQVKIRPIKGTSSRSRRQEEEKTPSSDRKHPNLYEDNIMITMSRLQQILEAQYSRTSTTQHASSSTADDTHSCHGHAGPHGPPPSSRT